MRDQLDLPARPPLFLDTLTDPARTWSKVGAWLSTGVSAPNHPFHRPVVTTVGADGFPEVRTVVLRGYDPDAREVVFHTDVRSPKTADLRRNPLCGFLLYDSEQLLQVRLRTMAVIHHADARARQEFDAIKPHTRATYAGGLPGEALPVDAPFDYPPRPPVDMAAAFTNFAAVVCGIQEADLLELHEPGHRRAKVWWAGGQPHLQRLGP
jgi:pyridoxamine 5'-phosphate oxidase